MARILDVFTYRGYEEVNLGTITLNDDGTVTVEGDANNMVNAIPCRDEDGNDHTPDEGEVFFNTALECREFNNPPYRWVTERTTAAPPALAKEEAPVPPEPAQKKAAVPQKPPAAPGPVVPKKPITPQGR